MAANTKHLTEHVPDIIERAAATLSVMLTAKQRVRAGGGEYEDVPDNKTRLAAAKAVFEIELPRAVKHQHQQIPAKLPDDGELTDAELDKMALNNPALLRRIAADVLDVIPVAAEITPKTATK